MRIFGISIITALFIFSCTSPEKFPEFVTTKTENVTLEEGYEWPAQNTANVPDEEKEYLRLDSLQVLQRKYYLKDDDFDLRQFRRLWNNQQKESDGAGFSASQVIQWFDATGFLFQLTGDAMVAEELERIIWTRFGNNPDPWNLDSLVAPYIFTRDVDHIHVNLFLPAEISYSHSIGGDVLIRQETDFSESGSIRLIFSMETKRYIELFIRIPSWAKNSTVTVKKVKYVAPAGSYSHISKKWKEGDEVEIEFSMENLPDYLKR
jgi:hypothetical protein